MIPADRTDGRKLALGEDGKEREGGVIKGVEGGSVCAEGRESGPQAVRVILG